MASPRYPSPVKNRRLLWPSLSPQKSNLLEQLIRRPGTVPLPCSPPAFELPKNDRHFLLGTKIVSSPHWRRVKKSWNLPQPQLQHLIHNANFANAHLEMCEKSSCWKQSFSSCWTCVAVWLGINSPKPSDLQIGDLANGNSYEINADLTADLMPFHIPRAGTLDKVRVDVSPDAEHIMSLTNSLILWFPKSTFKIILLE